MSNVKEKKSANVILSGDISQSIERRVVVLVNYTVHNPKLSMLS